MTGFFALLSKELHQYFATPIAYALIAVFWAASGYFFAFNVLFVSAAHMVTAFHNMSLILLLIVPVLTMRTFAEERRAGTLELLLTLPLREEAIVLAKFSAALAILLAMLAGSAAALVPLALFGRPDMGPILGGYIGVFLLGAAFLAIGIFVSSLSANQVVAAVVTWGLLALLWFVDYGAALEGGFLLARTLRHLSFSVHYLDIIRGVLNLETAVYFAGLIAVMLTASTQALKAPRS